MANYSEWNNALAEYFVSGVPKGTEVFLSVDSAALADVGNRFTDEWLSDDKCVDDFLIAVRKQCVGVGKVYIDSISDFESDTVPPCVGFLGAMVLAAHRMATEGDEIEIISDINYFTRLRQVLGFQKRTVDVRQV